jgi:hypothetical protein
LEHVIVALKIMREVTEWSGVEYRLPNHVYLMDGDKVYAYSKWGESEPQYMKTFLRMDRRGRKFEEVKKNTWEFDLSVAMEPETKPEPQGQVWTVQGSKGNRYLVNLNAGHWACTCPGFGFRHHCRHVEELQASQK